MTFHFGRFWSSELVKIPIDLPSSNPAWIWTAGRQQGPVVKTLGNGVKKTGSYRFWLLPFVMVGIFQFFAPVCLGDNGFIVRPVCCGCQLWLACMMLSTGTGRCLAFTHCYMCFLFLPMMIIWMSLISIHRLWADNAEGKHYTHWEKTPLMKHRFIYQSFNIKTSFLNLSWIWPIFLYFSNLQT